MPELRPGHLGHPAKDSLYGTSTPSMNPLSNSPLCLYNSYPSDFIYRNVKVQPVMADRSLQGLVETEVFVGGEEENFFQDDQSHLESIAPSSLMISYHKDSVLYPLNSVKEDIEAEAAEEEISGNFHSLDYLGLSMGPSSLSSSVISSVSLDEFCNFGSGTDRHHLPVITNKPQMQGSNYCPPNNYPQSSREPHGSCEKNAAISKLRHTQHLNSNGKLSPAICSSGSSSRALTNHSTFSSHSTQVKDENSYDSPSCSASLGTPQKSFLSLEKGKPGVEKRNLVWHNPSKSDKLVVTKKEMSALKRYGFCRDKPEAKEANALGSESKFSSLPRKQKEKKNEKDIVAETYGTLGRNRRKKEVCDQVPKPHNSPRVQTSDKHVRDLPQESKNILDKYATLPRKKAKEMSGRWREQMNHKENNRPPLQRSKSTGKGESSRSVRASPSPSLSASSTSSINSPRTAPSSSTKQSASAKLTTKVMSPSARLLARQSYAAAKDKADKTKPHSPSIYSSHRQPKLNRNSRKNVQVQVNLKWDQNEDELEEKLRKVVEENALLQRRLQNAEANAEEVEQMRMEAVDLRRTADNEKMEKEELQEELDKTSSKVKEMLTSMDGVEKEFNNRGESLVELEGQLQVSSEFNVKMQEKINHYEDYTIKLRKDLDKSLAAQKILLQQVQDLEAEGREIGEFMTEEKNALSECLKEAETELHRQRKEIGELSSKLQNKDEEARHMVRLAEERRRGYVSLQTELRTVQSSAEDMMVCQGAQLSEASVRLSNLTQRLQIITGKLVQDYSISENDIENVVTPVDSDSSMSSSAAGTPDLPKSPVRSLNRSCSPRKPASFMQSFLNAMRIAHQSSSSSKLTVTNAHQEGERVKLSEERKAPDGSDQTQPPRRDQTEQSTPRSTPPNAAGGSNEGTLSPPQQQQQQQQQSLSDQVAEVDYLLTRFMKVCCVLKSDADNILSELEDENERLCSQISLQQQMIDQQYSDFESLTNLESNARKELKLITKDLEFANATLNKVCNDEETMRRAKNVDEALRAFNLNLGRMETMHAEKRHKITQERPKLTPERPSKLTQARLTPSFTNAQGNHLCGSQNGKDSPSHGRHNRAALEGYAVHSLHHRNGKGHNGREKKTPKPESEPLNLSSKEEKSEEHDLDYIVNHVLKTLEAVPDIVSNSTALKNLYLHLSATDPLEQDVNCNPNNPFPFSSSNSVAAANTDAPISIRVTHSSFACTPLNNAEGLTSETNNALSNTKDISNDALSNTEGFFNNPLNAAPDGTIGGDLYSTSSRTSTLASSVTESSGTESYTTATSETFMNLDVTLTKDTNNINENVINVTNGTTPDNSTETLLKSDVTTLTKDPKNINGNVINVTNGATPDNATETLLKSDVTTLTKEPKNTNTNVTNGTTQDNAPEILLISDVNRVTVAKEPKNTNGNVNVINVTNGTTQDNATENAVLLEDSNSNLYIDCNANPEIITTPENQRGQISPLSSTSSDPVKFIPLLTNETSI